MVSQSDIAKTFGVVLLIVGVLGFVPNPIVGDPGAAEDAEQRTGAAEEGALFGTNVAHDLVHVASGLVALWAGFLSSKPEQHSRMYNVGFGLVYAVVTLLGFAATDTMRSLLAINTADNILHLAITVVLLGVGFSVDVEEQPRPA